MAKREILQVFVKSEVHKFMNAMDMADGGTKIFGGFFNKVMSKADNSNITVKDKETMITEGLKSDHIAFMRIGNRYGVKEGIMSLSNGKRFIFVPELKRDLEQKNIKEIKYGKGRKAKETIK